MEDKHDYWSLWPPWTWMAHGVISLAIAFVAALVVFVVWPSVLAIIIGFNVGSFGTATYFNLREAQDRRNHMNDGRYDESQPGAGTTSREDRVGDLVGPYAVVATSLVFSFLMAGAWLLTRQGG